MKNIKSTESDDKDTRDNKDDIEEVNDPLPQTMESQCWKDKEIWYETCKEVTTPLPLMCWSCTVRQITFIPLKPCFQTALKLTLSSPTRTISWPSLHPLQADAVPKCDTVTIVKSIEVTEKRCEPRLNKRTIQR